MLSKLRSRTICKPRSPERIREAADCAKPLPELVTDLMQQQPPNDFGTRESQPKHCASPLVAGYLRLPMKKIALLLFWMLWSLPLVPQGHSTMYTTRRCTSCVRDKHGHIKRSNAATSSFKKQHPCPATGKSAGRCPGYVIDHVKPLECGGTDAPSNMQWQTSAAAKAKDRTEAQCR